MDYLITFASDFISDNLDVKPHNSGRVCFLSEYVFLYLCVATVWKVYVYLVFLFTSYRQVYIIAGAIEWVWWTCGWFDAWAQPEG